MDAILKDTIERFPAPICIGLHQIDSSSKPYVIAEIGVNHNGDADQARRLIDAAHQAGADAAKFPVFSSSALAPADAPAAAYPARCSRRAPPDMPPPLAPAGRGPKETLPLGGPCSRRRSAGPGGGRPQGVGRFARHARTGGH